MYPGVTVVVKIGSLVPGFEGSLSFPFYLSLLFLCSQPQSGQRSVGCFFMFLMENLTQQMNRQTDSQTHMHAHLTRTPVHKFSNQCLKWE